MRVVASAPPVRPTAPETAPRKRSIGVGASLASLSEIATIAAGGLTTIVLARVLGPSGTGIYSIIYVFVAGLQTCSTLGIEIALLYYVGNGRWRAGDALRQTQLASLLLGLCGVAGGILLALIWRSTVFRDVELWLMIVGIAVLPFLLSATFASYTVLARDQYGAFALTSAGRSVGILVLVCLGAPLAGIHGAIVGAAVVYPATAVCILAWARSRMGSTSTYWLKRSGRALQRSVRFGIRVNLTNILSFLNQRADLLILSAFASAASVGRYAVAVAIVNIGWLLPKNLGTVVFPRAAAEASADNGTKQSLVDRSLRHGVALAFISAPIVALGLTVIPLVYSSAFAEATVLGLILVPGIAAYGVANLLLLGVAAVGRSKYGLYTALVVTPATLALYFCFIPAWGAIGAAAASTLSYSATAAILLVCFRRATGPHLPSRILPGRAEFSDYLALLKRLLAPIARRTSDGTT